jgi:hypothetical protein
MLEAEREEAAAATIETATAVTAKMVMAAAVTAKMVMAAAVMETIAANDRDSNGGNGNDGGKQQRWQQQ